MFTAATPEKMGAHLRELILKHKDEYESVRQFSKDCLRFRNQEETEENINRMENRFSQMMKGKKKIQLKDMEAFCELLHVSCEEILRGEPCEKVDLPLCSYTVALSNDETMWKEYLQQPMRPALYTDEYGKTLVDYALEFKNHALIRYLMDEGYVWFADQDPERRSTCGLGGGMNVEGEGSLCARYDLMSNGWKTYSLLREDIIALAIENGDMEMLKIMKVSEAAESKGE